MDKCGKAIWFVLGGIIGILICLWRKVTNIGDDVKKLLGD